MPENYQVARGDIVLAEPLETREPLVRGELQFADITNIVCRPAEKTFAQMHVGWRIGLAIAFSLLSMFITLIGYLIWTGVGIWGNTSPVFWAWPIVNFVFWVGI